MQCTACGGDGCRDCEEGQIKITKCPLEIVPAETFEVIAMADMLKKGLPPAAGGMLDQAKKFLDACRSVWAEQAHWEGQLKKGSRQ